LAFQLPEKEILRLPEQIYESLSSPEVKKALEATLNKFMLANMGKAGTGQLTDKEVKGLTEALYGAGKGAAEDVLIGKVKGTPEYKKLLRAINGFGTALNNSPLGVWVDNNKGLLIVTGVVFAVGGTAALFYTRAGGPFVDFPINQIKGKAIELWSPGNFTLSGKILEFQPAVRKLGVEVIGEQKWERVKFTLNLGIVASEKGVENVQGKAVAVFDGLTLKADGLAQPLEKKYKLGVGFEFGRVGPGSIDLSVHGIVTDGRLSGGDLSATYRTKPVDLILKGEADQGASKVMLMAGFNF
jgi:hypothetical protein